MILFYFSPDLRLKYISELTDVISMVYGGHIEISTSEAANRNFVDIARISFHFYQGQSFRIDIFKLVDQKINPKGLTPIVRPQ